MKKKQKQMMATLSTAWENQSLIEWYQKSEPKDRYEGYVAAVNEHFVLFHRMSEYLFLDGYVAVPWSELKSLRSLAGTKRGNFYQKALLLQGEALRLPETVDMTDFTSLVGSVEAHFPLIGIEAGYKWKGSLYIGRVARFKKRSVRLHLMTPSAEWGNELKIRFRDITRVQFGGHYESVLWRVSGTGNTLSDLP